MKKLFVFVLLVSLLSSCIVMVPRHHGFRKHNYRQWGEAPSKMYKRRGF